MSLLPTSMRDPDMQPLGPPLRLAHPPKKDCRRENMAKWFKNGQFEIDAESGKPVDADDPFRMTGLHDGLGEMLRRAGGKFQWGGVDLGRGEDKSSVQTTAPSNSEVKDYFKRAALGKVSDDERATFDRRLALRRSLGAARETEFPPSHVSGLRRAGGDGEGGLLHRRIPFIHEGGLLHRRPVRPLSVIRRTT